MIKFIDEKGIEHLAQAEKNVTNGVNGERSISGVIISNDIAIHSIGRGWKLEHEDELYCVTYALPVDEGNDVYVEFDAVHEFFYDFEKSVVHAELSGSHTFDAYLKFIFEGSGYSYRAETDVSAFEKESFGFKNRLTLFKDIINSVGVEFVVTGKIVRILNKVGTDLSTVVKKGFNLQELRLEHNIGSFITCKKGYGAFLDKEDKSKGRLEVEYLSPLAELFGKLEGEPILDERYKVEDNLLTRLKNDVDNSYSISVSLNMEDLNQAGYEQERPVAGDYIMAINDDIGFRQRVRIVSFTSSYDVDGNIIDHQIDCNSLSMSKLNTSTEDNWKKEIEAGLENAIKDINHALISADGKNLIFYGLFGENGEGEPEAVNVGDMWYKPVGEETVFYIWDGKSWVEIMSTVDNKVIQEKVSELEQISADNQTKSEQALLNAENARKEAEVARQEAFDSSAIAKQAEVDALNALAKGDSNSTQIENLEGQQKLTNTKVEGNTANILSLQSDSERLSLSIGKVQADVENTQTELATFEATMKGFQATVNSDVSGLQSQITQLSTDINLKVDKDNVISQINLSPEMILLDSKLIHLSGQSLIDDAVIKNSMIQDATISGAKIQNATISNANIISVNANKVVANTLSAITTNTGTLNVSGWLNILSENMGLRGEFDFNDDAEVLYPRRYEGEFRLSHRHLFFNARADVINPDGSKGKYHGYGESFYGANYFKSRWYDNTAARTLKGRIDIRDDFVQISNSWSESEYAGTTIKPSVIYTEEVNVLDLTARTTGSNIYFNRNRSNLADFRIGVDGRGKLVQSQAVYGRTYNAQAPVCVTPEGNLGRIVSAKKYKTSIEVANDLINKSKTVLSILPKSWNARNGDSARYYGFIADDFDDLGLKEVVLYNEFKEVEGLLYDRITTYHNVILSDHEKEIQELKIKIKNLEERLEYANVA